MKRTLFVAAYSLLAFATVSRASASTTPLTCKDLENSPRDEFFEASKAKTLAPDYSEKLIRKAAAIFLAIDTSKIPLKRLEKLAEEPATEVVQDPAGNFYAMAQIGFGGGNSINYYFEFGTLNQLPIALYDGDCVEKGATEALRVEDHPVFNGVARMECKIDDPNSPVNEYVIQLNVEDGNYTGDKAEVTAVTKKFGRGLSVAFNFNDHRKGARAIELSLTAREKLDASVFGKVFTNKVGGYWADDAYDFKFPETCKFVGSLSGTLYKRLVKY